jgi:hypothetical protein
MGRKQTEKPIRKSGKGSRINKEANPAKNHHHILAEPKA